MGLRVLNDINRRVKREKVVPVKLFPFEYMESSREMILKIQKACWRFILDTHDFEKLISDHSIVFYNGSKNCAEPNFTNILKQKKIHWTITSIVVQVPSRMRSTLSYSSTLLLVSMLCQQIHTARHPTAEQSNERCEGGESCTNHEYKKTKTWSRKL